MAGPAFEHLCRLWAEDMAGLDTFDGTVGRVCHGVVHDKHAQAGHEVDVAVFDPDGSLLAIGEAKWADVMGMGHLSRMEQTAGLLAARGQRPRVIVLFSGTGFTPELNNVATASGSRIQLIDLERLYTGS